MNHAEISHRKCKETIGDEVCKGELPGILREKSDLWKKNVGELQVAITNYQIAAKGDDEQRLLDAAEQLHAQYEKMVRLFRPSLKELDEVHAVLYPLYHYYMPQKDMEKIKTSATELKEKTRILEKATLPPSFKGTKEEFIEACRKLSESVRLLEASLPRNDQEAIMQRINAVHARYEEVSRILD